MVLGIFLLGACMGSFFYCIGLRLPVAKNVINARSECDNCKHVLSWWELIPIFSYIVLRGKCHHCHKRFSAVNLLMEIVTGVLYTFAYLYYGFSYDMGIFIILVSLMLIIFVSDFKYYIISDSPLIVSIILLAILQFASCGVKQGFIYLLCGFALFFTMYVVKLLGDKLFKKESLGGGDIKFAFIIGLAVGFRLGLCSLILSSFLALPYCCASLMLKKNNEVPFGPFLAASLLFVFFFSEKFLSLLNLLLIA